MPIAILWLLYALIGIPLVIGGLVTMGMARIRSSIPKTHILNRIMGLNMILFGTSVLLIFVGDWAGISGVWNLVLSFVGVNLGAIAAWSARMTSSDILRYLRQSPDAD